MRTTLALDDDVVAAAKAIARQQGRSLGEIISELARQSLRRPSRQKMRSGLALLPVSDPKAIVTLDTVNELRDELP